MNDADQLKRSSDIAARTDQGRTVAALRKGELIGIGLMLLAAVGATGAQILFKMSALYTPRYVWIACGVLVYVVVFFLTLMAYRLGRVSILYSVSAITLVMGALSGSLLFGEVVDRFEWAGIGLILLGVMMLGLDQPKVEAERVDT